jgi:hypothetical protein
VRDDATAEDIASRHRDSPSEVASVGTPSRLRGKGMAARADRAMDPDVLDEEKPDIELEPERSRLRGTGIRHRDSP